MIETPRFHVGDVVEPPAPVTTPPDYGIKLRDRRESYNLTIEDVAARLRIRHVYLKAFEDGLVSEYPADVYSRGFLRTYARYMQLDSDEIIMLYQRHTQQIATREQDKNVSLQQRRSLSRSEVWVAITLVFLLTGVGYWVYTILSVPISPGATATLSQSELARPEQPVLDVTLAEPDVDPEESQTSLEADSVAESSGGVSPSEALAIEKFIDGTDRLLQSLPSGTIIIAAISDTWVEIRDPEGVMVLSRILGAFETYIVPQRGTFFLTSGDAGNTLVHFGPGEWAKLGEAGTVTRNVPLTIPDLRRLP